MQLSRSLHLGSSRLVKATGRVRKKKCVEEFFSEVLQYVKQEKKRNNNSLRFYWKIDFFFFFFCGLTVAGTKEKKRGKKKRAGDWMGYCPFSSLGHDTTDCILTQGKAGARSKRCDTASRSPAILPVGPAIRPACARGEWQCTRVAWLARCVAI